MQLCPAVCCQRCCWRRCQGVAGSIYSKLQIVLRLVLETGICLCTDNRNFTFRIIRFSSYSAETAVSKSVTADVGMLVSVLCANLLLCSAQLDSHFLLSQGEPRTNTAIRIGSKVLCPSPVNWPYLKSPVKAIISCFSFPLLSGHCQGGLFQESREETWGDRVC